jgi:hypothetical protein
MVTVIKNLDISRMTSQTELQNQRSQGTTHRIEGDENCPPITMRDLEMINNVVHSHKTSDVLSSKTSSMRQTGNFVEERN